MQKGRWAMASGGNFFYSPQGRAAMYAISAAFCLVYAVDAARDLLSPERLAAGIETFGSTTFYAVTIARLVVCAWAGIAFARIIYKELAGKK